MKLVYICGFAWAPKGTVRSRAFPLAAEMVRRGHQVTLLIAPYDNPAYSGRCWSEQGVAIVNLEAPDPRFTTLLSLPSRLLRACERLAPDVVQVFKPKGIAGAVATKLLRQGRWPLVLDCDDWEGWGGWNDVQERPWAVKAFIDLQEQWLLRQAQFITAASHVLVERAHALGRRSRPVFHVPNGVSEAQLTSAKALLTTPLGERKRALGLPAVPLILYAGHFGPADDVGFFCRAAAAAASDNRAQVVLVGEGPELATTRAFFYQHKVDVHSMGRLSYDEYARVVAACDVATFPYPDSVIYRAKCSARILDYMLYGRAIVTTAVGENPHYLVEGESGLMAPAGDERRYAGALQRLLTGPELRQRLGEHAHRRAEQVFPWSGDAGARCEQAYFLAQQHALATGAAIGKSALAGAL